MSVPSWPARSRRCWPKEKCVSAENWTPVVPPPEGKPSKGLPIRYILRIGFGPFAPRFAVLPLDDQFVRSLLAPFLHGAFDFVIRVFDFLLVSHSAPRCHLPAGNVAVNTSVPQAIPFLPRD